MTLFLHWLRWDLRRFRWPLLAWTTLVAVFFSWIGYLNAHILSLDALRLKAAAPFAAFLGIVEPCILVALMGSDPAAGARAFWKTRPPSGFAVAGAKFILAVFFFLVLPLLGWCAAMQLCGLPILQPARWGNASWFEFIWWVEALSLSAIALAAAAARGAGSVVGRLLAGMAVFILFLAIMAPLLRALARGSQMVTPFNAAVLRGVNFQTSWPWLVTAVFVFLLMRRRRTPHPLAGMALLAMPVALCIAGNFIPGPPRSVPGVDDLPALDATLVSEIKITPQRMRSGFDYANRHMGGASHDGMVAWPLRLVIAGLPEDCMAYGRWTRARITAPDGRTVETAMPGRRYEAVDEPYGDGILPRSLTTVGMVFRQSGLAPFSLQRCRVEGVLELIVARKHERSVPLQPGATLRTRGDSAIMLSRLDLKDHAGAIVPVIEATLAGWDRGWMRLEKINPGGALTRLPVPQGDMSWQSGYFLQRDRGDIRSGTTNMFQHPGYARLARDIQRGELAGWTVVQSWYESLGRSEIAVSLDDIIIPRHYGDEREAETILAALSLSESTEPAEAVRAVRYALVLAQERQNTSQALEAELRRFLGGVRRKHFAALLDHAEPAPAERPEAFRPYEALLFRRLAELTMPEDIPALRTRELLFGKMKFDLAAAGLIPKTDAAASGRESNTDEALSAAWARGEADGLLVLQEAARRGLPWTVAGIQEVLALMPEIAGAWTVGDFMSRFSDCPADTKAGIPWLQQNAARLTWDAAAKRWVLPVKR